MNLVNSLEVLVKGLPPILIVLVLIAGYYGQKLHRKDLIKEKLQKWASQKERTKTPITRIWLRSTIALLLYPVYITQLALIKLSNSLKPNSKIWVTLEYEGCIYNFETRKFERHLFTNEDECDQYRNVYALVKYQNFLIETPNKFGLYKDLNELIRFNYYFYSKLTDTIFFLILIAFYLIDSNRRGTYGW